MPDKKLTDNLSNNSPISSNELSDSEIKKGLECHSRPSNSCGSNCPYLACEEVMCTKELSKDALDLINRLQAENERLCQIGGALLSSGGKLFQETNTIKAEAYKEFLPLLEKFRNEVVDKFIIMCDGNDYNKLNLMSMVDTIDCIYDKHLDNLLKEMVGEPDES